MAEPEAAESGTGPERPRGFSSGLSRRSFLKTCAVLAGAFSVPGTAKAATSEKARPMKPMTPEKALVLWYSQTGHTRRAGRLMASVWEKQGLKVKAADIRKVNPGEAAGYDLIALGSPVHYMEAPRNVMKWLDALPGLEGIPVASFVTYGGPGDGQENTAREILEVLAEKGGLPAGLGLFGNMSTFAVTWSTGYEKKILKYRHLPDENTFVRIRGFAEEVLDRVRAGESFRAERRFDLDGLMKHLPQLWFTRLLISRHAINGSLCMECGICEDLCPAEAISVELKEIDHGRCLACLGCLNNCPTGAMEMEFMGKKLYGFREFLKRQGLRIKEPEELMAEAGAGGKLRTE